MGWKLWFLGMKQKNRLNDVCFNKNYCNILTSLGGSIHYGEGGKGGSDGSKGGGDHGGRGSGYELSDISYLEHFVLTPGDGGDPHDRCGGGGGGILVNNHGPTSAYNQGNLLTGIVNLSDAA